MKATRIAVRLFEYGVSFVSRSEAKRLLRGLERFREAVGYSFADEVFRIWARAHPATRLLPVEMVPTVEATVERVRR